MSVNGRLIKALAQRHDWRMARWREAGSRHERTGEALLPDTPFPLAAQPHLISSPRLSDRHLCLALGMAPEEIKPALAWELNRRFLPGKLHRLGCLELIAALVHYPLDVTPQPPGKVADGPAG